MIKAVSTKLICLALITISSSLLCANDRTSAYIEQYKTIVINEMNRAGIPASIKMAQAILESASGQSTLAKQSRNHFGIKCGSDWDGDEVYRHDDDFKNGLLVRSCFRAFDDPADSFLAHSEFLKNNPRYNFLFELDIYDYKSWARGLLKAGYATDPNYASKLIDLIETNELYLLDLGMPLNQDKQIIAANTDSKNDNSTFSDKKKSKKQPILIAGSHQENISKYLLKDGYYTFKNGDKMTEIAAHFKMTPKELYFKNRLAYGATPRDGEQLSITSYIHLKDLPETVKDNKESTVDSYLFEEKIIISSL